MARTGDPYTRGDDLKWLGYDVGPNAHNPDWWGNRAYGPIFDMMDDNPPQGRNPAGTHEMKYQLDRDSLGDDANDDPHDMNDDHLDPDDEPDFAGRQLAGNPERDIAAQMYTNMQQRRAKDTAIRDEQNNIATMNLSDIITQDFGKHINPEAWDRFMNEGPTSEHVQDRRGMTDEEVQQLLEDDQPEPNPSFDPASNQPLHDQMQKDLGVPDLEEILQQLLINRSRDTGERIKT
jgi:hypothetical protein